MAFTIGNLISRITGNANIDEHEAPAATSSEPRQYTFRQAETYATIDQIEHRIAEINRAMQEAEEDRATFLRRKAENAESIERLYAEAVTGTPKDAAALSTEIARQKTFAVDPYEGIAEALEAESLHLRDEVRAREQIAAHDVYSAALREYCIAATVLPDLAQRVREAAVAAKIRLTPENSPGLMGGSLTINGESITLGPYTDFFAERERREALAAGGDEL